MAVGSFKNVGSAVPGPINHTVTTVSWSPRRRPTAGPPRLPRPDLRIRDAAIPDLRHEHLPPGLVRRQPVPYAGQDWLPRRDELTVAGPEVAQRRRHVVVGVNADPVQPAPERDALILIVVGRIRQQSRVIGLDRIDDLIPVRLVGRAAEAGQFGADGQELHGLLVGNLGVVVDEGLIGVEPFRSVGRLDRTPPRAVLDIHVRLEQDGQMRGMGLLDRRPDACIRCGLERVGVDAGRVNHILVPGRHNLDGVHPRVDEGLDCRLRRRRTVFIMPPGRHGCTQIGEVIGQTPAQQQPRLEKLYRRLVRSDRMWRSHGRSLNRPEAVGESRWRVFSTPPLAFYGWMARRGNQRRPGTAWQAITGASSRGACATGAVRCATNARNPHPQRV